MIKAILGIALPMIGAVAYMAAPAAQTKEAATPSLVWEEFARWRDFIRPKPEERRWQEIPWQNSLWAAAREAQRQDKPVLLWAMNGHPLACT